MFLRNIDWISHFSTPASTNKNKNGGTCEKSPTNKIPRRNWIYFSPSRGNRRNLKSQSATGTFLLLRQISEAEFRTGKTINSGRWKTEKCILRIVSLARGFGGFARNNGVRKSHYARKIRSVFMKKSMILFQRNDFPTKICSSMLKTVR